MHLIICQKRTKSYLLKTPTIIFVNLKCEFNHADTHVVTPYVSSLDNF